MLEWPSARRRKPCSATKLKSSTHLYVSIGFQSRPTKSTRTPSLSALRCAARLRARRCSSTTWGVVNSSTPILVTGSAPFEMTEVLNRGWENRDNRSPMLLRLERCGRKVEVDPQRIQEVLDRDPLHDGGRQRGLHEHVDVMSFDKACGLALGGQTYFTKLTGGLVVSAAVDSPVWQQVSAGCKLTRPRPGTLLCFERSCRRAPAKKSLALHLRP